MAIGHLYTQAAEALRASLSLAAPALAVCLVDEAPPGIPEVLHWSAAGCYFWQDGIESAIVTSARDHALCSIGM